VISFTSGGAAASRSNGLAAGLLGFSEGNECDGEGVLWCGFVAKG
jgi:hypothetical protein